MACKKLFNPPSVAPAESPTTHLMLLLMLGAFTTAAVASTLIARRAHAQSDVQTFISNVADWRYQADDATSFAFDQFYPGVDGKSDLTGQTVALDLGVTTLTVTRVEAGGALRDASGPFGWVSDAPLYAAQGIGSRWEFSTPIYAMYINLGSVGISTRVDMHLKYQGQEIGIISRYGGPPDGTYAIGIGFTSQVPIDEIDFEKSVTDDAILIGAFIGMEPGEPSLGQVSIDGYQGPHGPLVDYDFALTATRPNPFKLQAGTLSAGQNATFTVDGGTPDTQTYLVYSLTGLGQTHVNQLDVTLGLSHPLRAGSPHRTDAGGHTSWTLPIPLNARGRDVWFQAAQQGNASTIVATWIN